MSETHYTTRNEWEAIASMQRYGGWVIREDADPTQLWTHYMDSGVFTDELVYQLQIPREEAAVVIEWMDDHAFWLFEWGELRDRYNEKS